MYITVISLRVKRKEITVMSFVGSNVYGDQKTWPGIRPISPETA